MCFTCVIVADVGRGIGADVGRGIGQMWGASPSAWAGLAGWDSMAYTVVACPLMAYTARACTVRAYTVMAYFGFRPDRSAPHRAY